MTVFAIAFPALAAAPVETDVATEAADCPTAPQLSTPAEEIPIVIGDLALAPAGSDEPLAMSGSCEEYCMNTRWACVAACPGNPGEPANDACRDDCFHDYLLCMNECTCCIFPGFP